MWEMACPNNRQLQRNFRPSPVPLGKFSGAACVDVGVPRGGRLVLLLPSRRLLTAVEDGHLDPAPARRSADRCAVHTVQAGLLLEEVRHHLPPPREFANKVLQHVCRANGLLLFYMKRSCTMHPSNLSCENRQVSRGASRRRALTRLVRHRHATASAWLNPSAKSRAEVRNTAARDQSRRISKHSG